jgi:peptide/nickel transport system permease protein
MSVALPVTTGPSEPVLERQRFGYWRRLPLKAKVGAVLLGFFILAGIIGPLVSPYDPSFQNSSPSASLSPPSGAHLLGTTQSGQDVLSQLLVGIRLTLELAVIVGVVATVVAVLVGVTAAFLGGVWDELLLLLSNVFLVIPSLPLLILLLGYLPQKGQTATIVVLSGLGWPWGARVIRAQTLAIRNRDFIAASRETGESTWRIITFEIIPNEVSLIAASFVNTVLYAIGASVALAFIGLANLSSWSLGTMLYWAQSQQALQLGAWWWFLPPGLAVAFIGTALVLLNTGIDELGNPRLRDATRTERIGGHRVRPADPTPVLLNDGQPEESRSRGSRVGAFLHSFSRSSLLDEDATTPGAAARGATTPGATARGGAATDGATRGGERR